MLVEAVLGEFFASGCRSGWSSVLKIVWVSVRMNVQNAPVSNVRPDSESGLVLGDS